MSASSVFDNIDVADSSICARRDDAVSRRFMPAPTRAWTARTLSIWPSSALMSSLPSDCVSSERRRAAGGRVRGVGAQAAEHVAARAGRAAEDLVAAGVDGERDARADLA